MGLKLEVRSGDTIRIGDDVLITVKGDMLEGLMKLEFDAPRSIKILSSSKTKAAKKNRMGVNGNK